MRSIQVNFDNVPLALQSETKRYIEEIPQILRMSYLNNWGADYREKWFGERDTVRIMTMLSNIDRYLNSKCRQITLVKEDSAAHNVTTPPPKNMTGKVTMKKDDYLRIPSGLVIELAKEYQYPEIQKHWFYQTDEKNTLNAPSLRRVNKLFHEMSHKILKTEDVAFPGSRFSCYDIVMCKNLRIIHPELAIKNADNWGFYIADCFRHVFAGK